MPVGPGGSVVSGWNTQLSVVKPVTQHHRPLWSSPFSRLAALREHTTHLSSLAVPSYLGPRLLYTPWTCPSPQHRSRLPEAPASADRVRPRTAAANRYCLIRPGRNSLRSWRRCRRGRRLFQTCILLLELREGRSGGPERGFHRSLCSESHAREGGDRSA